MNFGRPRTRSTTATDPPASGECRWRKGRFLFQTALALAGAVWLFFQVLPLMVGHEIGEDRSWKFRRLDPWAVEATDLRYGMPGLTVSAAAIRLDLSPISLLERRVEAIRVAGLVVSVDSASIHAEARRRGESAPMDLSRFWPLPVTTDRLDISDAICHLTVQDRRLDIPFDATLMCLPDGSALARFHLFPRSQSLMVRFLLLPGECLTVNARWHGQDLDLGAFADFWPLLVSGVVPSGRVSVEGSGQWDVGQDATPNGLRVRTLLEADAVLGKIGGMEGISVRLPVAVEAAGSFDPVSGRWSIKLEPGELEPRKLEPASPETSAVTGLDAVVLGGVRPASRAICLRAAGEGDAGSGVVGYDLRLPGFSVLSGTVETRAPDFHLSGDLVFGPDMGTPRMGGRLELAAGRVEMGSGAMSAGGGLAVTGKWEAGDARFTARLEEWQVRDHKDRFSLDRVTAHVPLSWPWRAGDDGRVTAAGVRAGGLELGALTADLRSTAEGTVFSGRLDGFLLAGARVKIEGDSTFLAPEPRTRAAFRLSHALKNTDLGRFHSGAAGMRLSGHLDADAAFGLDDRGTNFSASFHLTDGGLSAPAANLDVEGLAADLAFSDLLSLTGEPGQPVKAAQVRLGRLIFSDVEARARVESANSLLLESTRFSWCDGTVTTGALRLVPGRDQAEVTLYCDRLGLAGVIAQLGGARAEGKGAVNGRIPLRYDGGRIQVDDGFLYSTPGDGGVIHLDSADLILAGIAPDTPQFRRLDLAGEALKHYEYEWVRLSMTSEGEDLKLGLVLDGRPRDPLPFSYRSSDGEFVRATDGESQSRFQGIRLNVNLSLPLNRILRYKDQYGDWTKPFGSQSDSQPNLQPNLQP